MKYLFSLFAALASLAFVQPAHAVTELIKTGSQTPIPFLLVDSATGQTGQTGLSGSVVVTVYKPGGSSFLADGGSVTELGNGDYAYVPSTAETAQPGLIYIHATCTGCQIVDTSAQVVAFDPTDAVALGLSSITATAQQANNAASLTTYGVATPATSATAIWAASTRTITGGSLTVAPPSASQIASVILSTPANLLNTDSSGRVPLQPTESFNNTGQTTNYPTSGGGSVSDTSVQGDVTASLSGLGINSGWVTGLGTVNTDVPLIYTAVNALPSASAIASATLGSTMITIQAAQTTNGVSEQLSLRQFLAYANSVLKSNASNTAPTPNSTATVTYYLLGYPETTNNIVAISTPAYDANGTITGLTVKVANPFPTF